MKRETLEVIGYALLDALLLGGTCTLAFLWLTGRMPPIGEGEVPNNAPLPKDFDAVLIELIEWTVGIMVLVILLVVLIDSRMKKGNILGKQDANSTSLKKTRFA